MFARALSAGVLGVDAFNIEVEVDCSGGIGQIQIVGLPDAAVKESQERVRSAIKSCEFIMPPGKKWVVNLAPADVRKEGPSYDLPIAVGILAATGCLPAEQLANFYLIGELSLDGSVRPVSGVLPVAIHCLNSGCKNIIVPDGNAEEAGLVVGLNVYAVSHLQQVCNILRNPKQCNPVSTSTHDAFCKLQASEFDLDYAEVKGQQMAKRALEIAAAGKHNILMVGPPGSGKSMLAQRLASIMPPLLFCEALELTKLYSVAGLTGSKSSLVTQRPFRAPHHTASSTGLVGGGTIPKPGEISLSHLGILFLDELTEFPRRHLDTLRQPLEVGCVTISRAQQTLTYPASFLLIGACNPCPCGYRGDPVKPCICNSGQADRYWARLSGPFLDRIDLHVEVGRLKEPELAASVQSESSESIRLRVLRAVRRQRIRTIMLKEVEVKTAKGALLIDDLEQIPVLYNGQLGHRQLRQVCRIDEASRNLLARAVTMLGLSARAYDRVLRIARTIADLEDEEEVQHAHIAEAIRYRALRSPVCN